MKRLAPLLILILALSVTVAATAGAKKSSKTKIRGGETTLALSGTAAGALQTLGIELGVVGPATAGRTGVSFPIRNTNLRRKLVGSIGHRGGLALERGAVRVELTDFIIELDRTPTLSALVGGTRIDIAELDLSEAGIFKKARRFLVITRVGVNLSETAAQALNGAFQTTAFASGLDLGIATVEAKLKRKKSKR